MKKILLAGVVLLAILLLTLFSKTMNKKIFIILMVVLLIVAATFIFKRINNRTSHPPIPISNPVANSPRNTVPTPALIPDKNPSPEPAPISIEKNNWIQEGAIYNVNIAQFDTNKTYLELSNLIPKLKELGIKTIYLAPIWNSIETQKSKTSGYSLINNELNSNYGTEQDLRKLISTVHANDMKILFDLVISYRPEESIEYKNSPEMFLHYKNNGSIYHWRWEPSTDQTSPAFIARISDMAEYYVKNFDIDGWRIDAPQINIKEGDEKNLLLGNGKPIPSNYGATELLKEVKRKITAVKADAILYAEMPGPLCERDSQGCDTAFDEDVEASYNWYFSGWLNYPTRLPVGSITYKDGFLNQIVNNKVASEDLVNYMIKENKKNNRVRSHFSENHDTQRVQVAYPKQNKALLTLISTIPGVPMIHAGQETGNTKKQVIELSRYNINSDLWKFYSKVLNVRNSSASLKYGDIKNVWKSGDNVYAYSRTYENETIVVMINFNSNATGAISYLDLPFAKGAQLKDELSGEIFVVSDPDNFKISVPAYGSRILTVKK
jgi:glycosidase